MPGKQLPEAQRNRSPQSALPSAPPVYQEPEAVSSDGVGPPEATGGHAKEINPQRFADLGKSSGGNESFEACAVCCSWALVIVFFPFSLCCCYKVFQEYERAVVFRNGRYRKEKVYGPGMVFYLPCTDEFMVLDVRTRTFELPLQAVLTLDSVNVTVGAVLSYFIESPFVLVGNVSYLDQLMILRAQAVMRLVFGEYRIASLVQDRKNVGIRIRNTLEETTKSWGLELVRLEVKNIELPGDMKRAMAAEAEAMRDAKARRILASGEEKAAKLLQEAARNMQGTAGSGAIQLRFLQTMNDVSSDNANIVVIPMPVHLLYELFNS